MTSEPSISSPLNPEQIPFTATIIPFFMVAASWLWTLSMLHRTDDMDDVSPNASE
jgi:hypothetical protein